MAGVTLDRVTVDVGGARILGDIDLDVADGSFVGIVGPSGSGKTTLLRAIAGLTPVDGGRIALDGVDVTGVPPELRDVGMVFQQPALIPNRNVRRNVAFPLEIRRQHVDEIRRRVGAETRALHLEHLLLRRPSELSLGEEHLVQIARAIVRVPRVLLLDEPFANLDRPLHDRIRHEITTLQDGYGVTTLMATNDPVDALTMPTVLAVVDGGHLAQCAPPLEVRASPATLGAAVATGDVSVVRVTVRAAGDGFDLVAAADGAGLRWRVRSPAYADRVGDQVTLATRPEDVVRDPDGPVRAVLRRRLAGAPPTLVCRIGGDTLVARGEADTVEVGSSIGLRVERATVFDATTGYAIT